MLFEVCLYVKNSFCYRNNYILLIIADYYFFINLAQSNNGSSCPPLPASQWIVTLPEPSISHRLFDDYSLQEMDILYLLVVVPTLEGPPKKQEDLPAQLFFDCQIIPQRVLSPLLTFSCGLVIIPLLTDSPNFEPILQPRKDFQQHFVFRRESEQRASVNKIIHQSAFCSHSFCKRASGGLRMVCK